MYGTLFPEFFTGWKKQVPFIVATENVELVYVCCPQHVCFGTARIKQDKKKDMRKTRLKKTWKSLKVADNKEVPLYYL